MEKEQKRRLLIELLDHAPRGTKTRLAKHCQVNQKTVTNWLTGEAWPQTREDEIQMWAFFRYEINGDGGIVKKEESTADAVLSNSPVLLSLQDAIEALDRAQGIIDHLRQQFEQLEQFGNLPLPQVSKEEKAKK